MAALGVGGVALAQSSGSTPATKQSGATIQSPQRPDPAVEAGGEENAASENSAADQDAVQAGDQDNEVNDSAGADANDAADQGEANDKGDVESDSATEQESGSEAPGDDGPGGHADEPGNPNANHEVEGQE
jgi:hypothetical protein